MPEYIAVPLIFIFYGLAIHRLARSLEHQRWLLTIQYTLGHDAKKQCEEAYKKKVWKA